MQSTFQQEQLSLIEKFGSMNVRICGSIENPLFNSRDIMETVLGYANMGSQKWWKYIANDPEMVSELTQQNATGSRQVLFLTEYGLIEVLSKSSQQVAKNFRKWITQLLKNLRLGQLAIIQKQQEESQWQLQQANIAIEESKKEIEELKKPKMASVYQIKYKGRLLYVGKDKSKLQNRAYQHLTERRKIAQNNQVIDIFLASVEERDIEFCSQPCMDFEADHIEKQLIQQLSPEFNQSMNGKLYICNQCDPKKIYQNRASYEKHFQQVHEQQ